MAKITLEKRQLEIAERIAMILERKGWNQQDLADATSKGKSYISAILAGETNLTLKTILLLENALGERIIEIPQ